MQGTVNALTSAMFIANGMRDNPEFEGCTEDGSFGMLELMAEAGAYGLLLDYVCQETTAVELDFPGVFDYEVSEPFGLWFIANLSPTTSDNEPFPRRETCIARIFELAWVFFTKGDASVPHLIALGAAFDSARRRFVS